ncbi:Uncharacterised protein [[Clostridium] sordellii]|nr:Uncharacterised protein [[Clostridium] sordellii] [Paeniclostridium sordellii]
MSSIILSEYIITFYENTNKLGIEDIKHGKELLKELRKTN